jgi:hypothetical protein
MSAEYGFMRKVSEHNKYPMVLHDHLKEKHTLRSYSSFDCSDNYDYNKRAPAQAGAHLFQILHVANYHVLKAAVLFHIRSN